LDRVTNIKPDEQSLIDSVHKFIEAEVAPIQAALGDRFWDERQHYTPSGKEAPEITAARRQVREASARAGFYTMFCPKDYGGAELGVRLWFLCWESLFHRYGPPSKQLAFFVFSHFTSGPHEVWKYAKPELQAEVLPELTAGRLQGCFGMSEPDAGSDAWMMRTTAVRDGDDWVINGMKQWTSWSPTADFVMVYAITDKALFAARRGGISCFYVPTDTPGFKVESVIKIFGRLGGSEGILSFTDVRVPDKHMVGELNRGFDLAMLGVRHGRLANAGRTLGLGRWALEKTIDYAKVRKTFGSTLAEHQTIRNYIAEATAILYAGRAMALDCADKADQGRDVRTEVSILKYFTTENLFTVLDKCIQIHGGMGLVNETRLYDAWHQARMTRIVEGASEIQLRQIAQHVLSGRVDLTFA